VIRPCFYDFPDDTKAWEWEDQYLFGPDYLVAPITGEGLRERDVYLPAGARWTNAWTGESFEGGRTVRVNAPLDTIPVFCRDGARLPV
jgi:alpha-D-xyloside xylohydrolase